MNYFVAGSRAMDVARILSARVDVIKLHGTDIETTRLGFGCAGLMRLTSKRRREAILSEVFEGGVRYFDVARMYGLGKAESELGNFLKGRRDKVVVATKFGIELKPLTGAAAMLQGVGRYVLNAVPSLRGAVRRRAGNFYAPKNFDAAFAQASLEQSLKALKTDHIDILLLHEPTLDEIRDAGLIDYLERAKEKGHIRAWGVAGYPQQIMPICKSRPELTRIIQIPNDVVCRQMDSFAGYYSDSAFITFSPYAEAYGMIKTRLAIDLETQIRWSTLTNTDLARDDNLASLVLGYCLIANRDGIVLFSSSRPQGVKAGIGAWKCGFSREQVQTFADLVRSELVRPVVPAVVIDNIIQ